MCVPARLVGIQDWVNEFCDFSSQDVNVLTVCACQIGRHSRLSEWILRFQFTRRKRSNCIDFYSWYYRTNERETKWHWCACQIGRHSRLSEWILRFQFTRRKRSNCIDFYSWYYRTNERETKWHWEREPTKTVGIHDTEKYDKKYHKYPDIRTT